MDIQSVRAELDNLASLLQENNLEAVTLVDKLAKPLSQHPQWTELNGQVQSLAFMQALETLRAMMLENA